MRSCGDVDWLPVSPSGTNGEPISSLQVVQPSQHPGEGTVSPGRQESGFLRSADPSSCLEDLDVRHGANGSGQQTEPLLCEVGVKSDGG